MRPGIRRPLRAGALLLIAAEGWPRTDGAWARICGGGFILGNVLLGALLALYPGSTQHVSWYVAPPLLLLSTIAAVFLWRRPAAGNVATPVAGARLSPWAWLLLALLFLQFALLAAQAWWLPTLPWDAWTTWMARAKGWYHADMFLPIVPFERWWLGEPGTVLFGHAAVYREHDDREKQGDHEQLLGGRDAGAGGELGGAGHVSPLLGTSTATDRWRAGGREAGRECAASQSPLGPVAVGSVDDPEGASPTSARSSPRKGRRTTRTEPPGANLPPSPQRDNLVART